MIAEAAPHKEGQKQFDWHPGIEIGESVLYAQDLTQAPQAAYVVNAGPRTVDVQIMFPGWRFGAVKVGIRHKDDPERKETNSDGFWYLAPRQLAIRKLVQEFSRDD